MAEGEKFNLIKAITSPFTGLYWVKTVMFSLGAAALLFIGYGVYKAYFKKPPHTTEQNAEAIYNYNYTPKMFGFGCIRMDKRLDNKTQ
jgi:hypothetical protein